MTWGRAWGDAWGAAFGDSAAVPTIITGSGAVEQLAGSLSGTGNIPGGAAAVVAPDRFPGGVPSTKFAKEAGLRNGYVISGVGQVDQPLGDAVGAAQIKLRPLLATATASQYCGNASGTARIKLVSLVAASASVAHGAGEVAATAEFRDIELEMIALLLAA